MSEKPLFEHLEDSDFLYQIHAYQLNLRLLELGLAHFNIAH